MKKSVAFLGAAAAALMMAGTAHAEGGYVGLSYNSNNDTDANVWAVNGAVATSNLQFDAGYGRIDLSGSNGDQWNVGAHLFNRSDSWLWGGYVGYENVSGGGSIDEWTVALQTQFYMPRTTISGNLSYSTMDNFPFLGNVHTTEVDGEVRFFGTDNFSIQGNLGWGNLDTDVGSGNFWTYGLGAEWQADSFPVSIYAGWNGLSSNDLSDSNAWTVGIRYNWGGTLLQRNRSGPGLSSPLGILNAIF